MNGTNGHGGPGAGAAVARPVVLVRYRPGVIGETARTVHVVSLPTDERVGVVGALCGAALIVHDIEIVTPREGMPCTLCVLTQALGTVPPGESGADAAGLAAGGAAYQGWGWPVTLHRDQVRVSLHCNVSARAIQSRSLPRSQKSSPGDAAPRRCWPTPTPPSTTSCSPGNATGCRCPGPTRCTRSAASCCCLPPPPHAGRSPGYGSRRRTHCGCAARSISLEHCVPHWATPYRLSLKSRSEQGDW